jgi:hypothetical protein
MTVRANRSTQNGRRKVIGAVVVSGALIAAGISGVQLASASTTTKAANIISVDGQQFDVSQCQELQINGGQVLCDGEQLVSQAAQDPAVAALESAQALEAACDAFAADVAAGQQNADQNAQDQNAQDQNADDEQAAAEAAAAAKAANKKLAKKWAKAMAAADKMQAEASASAAAQDDQNAQDVNADAAVTAAQQALLQSCLDLATAKEAAGVNANDDQNAEETASPSATDETTGN